MAEDRRNSRFAKLYLKTAGSPSVSFARYMRTFSRRIVRNDDSRIIWVGFELSFGTSAYSNGRDDIKYKIEPGGLQNPCENVGT
jgi:hypothetical protein